MAWPAARHPDRWVGVVCLIAGGLLFWETFSFRRVDWDPLGLPFWPRVVLGLIGLASVWLILKGDLGRRPAEPIEPRALAYLAGLLVYLASVPALGFVVATPPYLFLFHRAMDGGRRIVEGALVAALGTAALWLLFVVGLGVPLPPVPFLEEPL
mgnify:CR=1 FL=1